MAKKKSPVSEELLPPSEPIVAAENEPDPRKDAMDEIYANRRKQFEKESGLELNREEDAPSEELPQETPPSQEPPVEPLHEEPPIEQPKKISLTVNGRTIEATPDEMTVLAQKGLSAEERYQAAARMRDEAAQLAAIYQQNQAQPQARPQNPTHAPSELLTADEAREIAQRMNYGSADDQAKALTDLVHLAAKRAQDGNQMPTPDAIANKATQQALAYLSHQQEESILRQEFTDIITDIPLAHAADVVANQLKDKYAALGVQKSRLEIFREAGAEVRSKYLKPSVPTNYPVQAALSQDKLERKRAAPQPPAATTHVAKEAPAPAAPTGSQIVAQMRKARGLPV